MLPTSWFALASFFVLVAPGALLNGLTSGRRVRPVETALQELARIVLASVTFSVLGLIVASLVSRWLPELFLSPTTLAFGEIGSLRGTGASLLSTVAVVLVVSLGSVWIWNRWASRADATSLSPTSAWQKAIREDLPAGQYPFVRVALTNGSSYLGRVRSYSPDLDSKDRELILAPPLMTCDTSGRTTRLDAEWKRIVIAESQIVTLTVAYVAEAATTGDGGATERPV